jgi:hypothetical protein
MEQGQAAAPVKTAAFQEPPTANEFVENELHRRLEQIEGIYAGHALSLNGPLIDGVDDFLRGSVERRRAGTPKTDRLVIVLTTEGGYIETVQRMVDTVRRHYRFVDFIIPNQAFSAGTIMALSGDSIHMDYYSRLGPIDPQIESQPGRRVSALGYLERYNALLKRAQNPKIAISPAEVNLLISGFDQGELYHYEQARELSIALLEKWLVSYKFKNWTVTETRKMPVTETMKRKRASTIGKQLNETKRWHSHGHGISMEVLRRDLNLLIDDFEQDPPRCAAIRGYYTLLSDYMLKRGANGTVHIVGDYRSFM